MKHRVQNVENLRIFFPNSTQPLAEDATFNSAHLIPFMKTTNNERKKTKRKKVLPTDRFIDRLYLKMYNA